MALKSWAQSSTDPEQVSNTIKGAVLGASALLIWAITTFTGVEFGTEQISMLAVQLGGAGAAIWTIYGLVQKGLMRVAKDQ